jgi:hypothetical protein
MPPNVQPIVFVFLVLPRPRCRMLGPRPPQSSARQHRNDGPHRSTDLGADGVDSPHVGGLLKGDADNANRYTQTRDQLISPSKDRLSREEYEHIVRGVISIVRLEACRFPLIQS